MKLFPALLTSLLVASCSGGGRSADLIFVVEKQADDAGMSDAIIEATGSGDVSATHVGIIEVSDGQVYVIDAAPRSGVSRRPLGDFIEEFIEPGRSYCVIKRLGIPFDADSVISKAKRLVGRQYDFGFLPGDDRLYCSELVQVSYLGSDGKPVFDSKPMNFKDSEGNYPEFWQSLFDRLGVPVPQGVPGTNPTDMMHSPLLRQIEEIHITQ